MRWFIVLMMLLVFAGPASGGELFVLYGATNETGSQYDSFAYQVEYREGLSENVAVSVSYLNEAQHRHRHRRRGNRVSAGCSPCSGPSAETTSSARTEDKQRADAVSRSDDRQQSRFPKIASLERRVSPRALALP